MKKVFFIVVLTTVYATASFSQDTVRYGDPWYAFHRPMPTLNGDTPYSLYPDVNVCYPCTSERTYRRYYGYKNDNFTNIYGIAVVMDSLPKLEYNYIVTLLRGINWHHFYSDSSYSGYPYTIVIDSLYQEDTVNLLNNPLIKQCYFEYFYNYDSVTGNYKGSAVNNCYEFYFDSPLKDMGLNALSDTFFVGVSLRPSRTLSSNELASITPKVCMSNSVTNIFLSADYNGTNPPDSIVAIYSRPGFSAPLNISTRFWGGIFPIVELRCSVPSGLALTEDSLSVYWSSNDDTELFQLSICNDMTDPDLGRLFSTPDTAFSLPVLHSDSTYRLYLRKACTFRQDSVWSDWSDPLVIAARSTNGISSVSILDSQFSISPNPTDGTLTVRHSATFGTLTLTDLQGRVISESKIKVPEHQLDLSSLPPATYLLTLTTPDGKVTRRVVKK